VEGERRIEGVLTAADDEGIVVEGRALSYAEIERARTVFVWGPAPKPGRTPGKKATA
jgi:ribosome maturation factor RimP